MLQVMVGSAVLMVTILATTLSAFSAAAEKQPSRSARERAFADQIRTAGHPCPLVKAFGAWDDEEAGKLREQRMVTSRVRCSNGLVFGVANPQSRTSRSPAPVVKRLQ
jgi:hypothetical protein